MIRRTSFALLLGLALVVASGVIAQDNSGLKEQDSHERPRAGRARLVKPWADLTTLTEEQKQKIIAIHSEAVAKINEIRKQEEADIMAVLTPEQKTELADNEAKRKADDKARRTPKKDDAAPAAGGNGQDEDRKDK